MVGAGIAFALLTVFSNSGASAADKVVFGTVPIAGTSAAWVGKDAGYFEEAGIDLEIANAVQFANIVADVMAGTYQFGTVSVGTAAQAIIEGLPIKIVANTYHSAGEQKLMALSSGPIKTIADLKGKHIGLGGLNNNFQAGIIAQMKEAGVDPSTVTFTLISPPDLPASLRNGVVDAAQINEPGIVGAGDEFTASHPGAVQAVRRKPLQQLRDRPDRLGGSEQGARRALPDGLQQGSRTGGDRQGSGDQGRDVLQRNPEGDAGEDDHAGVSGAIFARRASRRPFRACTTLASSRGS